MDAMSTFNKVLLGAFGLFTGVMIVAAVSHHQSEIAEWTSRQTKKLSSRITQYRKSRQMKRAQGVASEM